MPEKPSDTDIKALLSRLLHDDPAAWCELVRDYSGLLMSIAGRTFAGYGFPAEYHDREDVVAEVWRNVLDNDRRIIRNCLVRGFFLQTLHVLTRRRAIDLMRSRKIRTEVLNETEAVDLPQNTVFDNEEYSAAMLHKAIASLAPRERMVTRLFFLQGKSYREITSLSGILSNSIGPTIARSLLKLRAILQRLK